MKNEASKINVSIAKSLFVLSGVILVVALIVFIYFNFVKKEPLSFYRNIDNCSVVTEKKTSFRSYRSRRKLFSRTVYYVHVKNYDESIYLDMIVGSAYYDAMSRFNGRSDVTLSFFKTKRDKLFPAYSITSSSDNASVQYRECYPPALLNSVLFYVGSAGIAILIMGLSAFVISQKYKDSQPVDPFKNVEYPVKNSFDPESDEAAAKDPYLYAGRHNNNASQKKQNSDTKLSASERDELLKQFDKLTSDGKYKYKTHD